METINNILYMISTGLLIPVILVLIFFFVKALMLIGQFYGIYISRNKFASKFEVLISKASDSLFEDLEISNFTNKKNICSRYLEKLSTVGWKKVHSEKFLGDMETDIQKELEKTKIIMRVGPMLGLMGTLIPMGPALVGLAAGDMDMMARNMQIAFSTTVVGVFIGAVGFVIGEIKKRWFIEDLKNLTYLFELAQAEKRRKKITSKNRKKYTETKTLVVSN